MMLPQSGYYEDHITEAAALWEAWYSTIRSWNGNNRVAGAAADIHLRLNGLDVDGAEAADFIEDLFRQSEMRIALIEPWLRPRVREL